MPCIDPRAEKNRHYTDREAVNILDPLITEHNIDPERPILAAISRYDIHKNQHTILQAFKELRSVKKYDPRPYLIFLGNTQMTILRDLVYSLTLKNKQVTIPISNSWLM